MDLTKIGQFIAQLRKERQLTQEQLGEQLGVTSKTVSRWETGAYLPPVEMLLAMSELFELSINELLSGQRLSAQEYRQAAEDNLTQAVRESRFSAKEQLDFFQKKWKREHRAELTLVLLLILALYVAAICFRWRALIWLGVLSGPAYCIHSNNRMMAYAERHVFDRAESEI